VSEIPSAPWIAVSAAFGALGRVFLCVDREFRVLHSSFVLDELFGSGGSSEVLISILAPGVIENHAAFGISHLLAAGKAAHITVVRAFGNRVVGPNVLEAPGQQQITLKMNQWEYEVGFSFGF